MAINSKDESEPVVVGRSLKVDVGAPTVVVVVAETNAGSGITLSSGAGPEYVKAIFNLVNYCK